jgi:putative sterol carrier protein
LQHVVTGAPVGEVRYHVRVGDRSATIIRGDATAPDVTFAEDYATAADIASGQLSAAAALLSGRIRVSGDMGALIAHRDLLNLDDPVPPAVRATTSYR